MDPATSMLLLKEARDIEKTSFWKRYNEQLEKIRIVAQQKCYERGDKEFEKGTVDAFNIILGYKQRLSIFNQIKENLNAGVATSVVPK